MPLTRNLVAAAALLLAAPVGGAEPTCRVRAAKADYERLVVLPVASRYAIVEEEKYQHLPPSLALSATEQLKERFEGSHLFQNVTIGEACPEGAGSALRLEASIVGLSHYDGAFHLTVRVRVPPCSGADPVYTGEQTFHCRQEAISSLPTRIAAALVDTLRLKATRCEEWSR